MIGYIKGKILDLTAETALIQTSSGLGFEVYVSGSALGALSGKSEGELYIYTQIKEDGATLFGFSSKEEKQMFLKLISVSGVGPKMGIGVLSSMNVGDIATAIATNDVKKLSAVKGLGKKTAERIILELREKVSALPDSKGGTVNVISDFSSDDEDAVVALMTLGFNRAESIKAISVARANGAKTVEEIIMTALKSM